MTCLLKDWHHEGIFPVLWKDTLFKGSLEIRESDGTISLDISFKSLPGIWSGPLDLCSSISVVLVLLNHFSLILVLVPLVSCSFS